MGITQEHALGRKRKFFAKLETTAGTIIKPTSGDAMKVVTSDLKTDGSFDPRIDSSQNRSVQGVIEKAHTLEWSLTSYLLPSGAAGTPPDAHPLIRAAMGASGYTNTPGVSDIYLPTSEQALDTLTLIEHTPDVFSRLIYGAFVESLTLAQSGGDEPRLTLSGGGMGGHAYTATDTLNGAMAASTNMVVTGADMFTVGSIVKIGADDNSGAGFLVLAKVGASQYTIDAAATANNGDVVIPFTPSETTAGAPLGGLVGTATINGSIYPLTSWEVTLANNTKSFSDEVFQKYPSDAVAGKRSVGFTAAIRARKDHYKVWVDRFGLGEIATNITIGNAAGRRLKIDNKLMLNIDHAYDLPDAEEAIFNITGIGSTSVGDDEMKITFD